ncbi:hypothetical protein [Thalassospira marina]|nr:hypothetical protein [Thalassospira marina]
MTITPMPTENKDWGFWGTARVSEYDVEMTWDTVSKWLADRLNLTALQVRDTLDSRLGRHLCDDLSSIDGGPRSPAVINTHLDRRLSKGNWKRQFQQLAR